MRENNQNTAVPFFFAWYGRNQGFKRNSGNAVTYNCCIYVAQQYCADSCVTRGILSGSIILVNEPGGSCAQGEPMLACCCCAVSFLGARWCGCFDCGRPELGLSQLIPANQLSIDDTYVVKRMMMTFACCCKKNSSVCVYHARKRSDRIRTST